MLSFLYALLLGVLALALLSKLRQPWAESRELRTIRPPFHQADS